MTREQQDLLDILQAWNQGVANLVEREFISLNSQIRKANTATNEALARMNTKHQPPQSAKKARV